MARIHFIKHGPFSGTNEHVRKQLAAEFPDHELRVIDVRKDWINHDPVIRLAGRVWAAVEFFPLIARRRRTIGDVYLRTRRMGRYLKEKARKEAVSNKDRPAFTFATQSLYDVAVPGIPHFVFTDHTHLTNLYYPAFDRDTILPEKVIAMEKDVYTQAARVLVMGSHVKRSLEEHYQIAPGKVVVCGGGPNVVDFPLLDNSSYSNGRIAFVGVEWERKGGPVLQDAFKKVKALHPDARLDIIGCELSGLPEGMVSHGRLPHAGVAALLAQASLFVFPTLIEPFGIAPIEAATMGLPVVATSIGALPDIVQDGKTGFLVPPHDSDSLADAICRLLAAPELAARLGTAGREHALMNFTWRGAGRIMGRAIREGLENLPSLQ